MPILIHFLFRASALNVIDKIFIAILNVNINYTYEPVELYKEVKNSLNKQNNTAVPAPSHTYIGENYYYP